MVKYHIFCQFLFVWQCLFLWFFVWIVCLLPCLFLRLYSVICSLFVLHNLLFLFFPLLVPYGWFQFICLVISLFISSIMFAPLFVFLFFLCSFSLYMISYFCLSLCLLVSLTVCLSVSVCRFVGLSVCRFVGLSVYRFVCLFAWLFVCQHVHSGYIVYPC